MDIKYWMLWAISETTKYIVISYGIIGFEMTKTKKKYFILLYLLLGIAIINYYQLDDLVFRTLLGIIILYFGFEENIIKKIQNFLISNILISIIDLLIWLLIIYLLNLKPDEAYSIYKVFAEYIAILFWILLAYILRNKRKIINRYFIELSVGYYIILLVGVWGISIIVGCVQGALLNQMTNSMKEAALIACIIVAIYILIVCILLIYNNLSKKHLTQINELKEECLFLQKKYYEKIINNDESLRVFRHDIRNHMKILNSLCKDNRMQEVKQYIYQITDNYNYNSTIKTGNLMADYLINDLIEGFNNIEVKWKILGKFPDALQVQDSDMCILLANAFDNAKEGLSKVEGKKEFIFQVKNYNEHLYIDIINSAVIKNENILYSNKLRKEEHGYGSKNMKTVVQKYGGKIEWIYADNKMKVQIEL